MGMVENMSNPSKPSIFNRLTSPFRKTPEQIEKEKRLAQQRIERYEAEGGPGPGSGSSRDVDPNTEKYMRRSPVYGGKRRRTHRRKSKKSRKQRKQSRKSQ